MSKGQEKGQVIQVESLIDRIVGLRSMAPHDLSPIAGHQISQSEIGVYWSFFEGRGNGLVSKTDLRISSSQDTWLVSLTIAPALAPKEVAVDLKRYGPKISMDVNPDVPPQGTYGYSFTYRGRFVGLDFSSNSHRLCQIVIRKD